MFVEKRFHGTEYQNVYSIMAKRITHIDNYMFTILENGKKL